MARGIRNASEPLYWEVLDPTRTIGVGVCAARQISIGDTVSSLARGRQSAGLQRQELLAAAAEVTAIVGIFLFAFTTRGMFGDTVRYILITLSLLAGFLGTLAGGWLLYRAAQLPAARLQRVMLGGFMAAIGIYTIVHVL